MVLPPRRGSSITWPSELAGDLQPCCARMLGHLAYRGTETANPQGNTPSLQRTQQTRPDLRVAPRVRTLRQRSGYCRVCWLARPEIFLGLSSRSAEHQGTGGNWDYESSPSCAETMWFRHAKVRCRIVQNRLYVPFDAVGGCFRRNVV